MKRSAFTLIELIFTIVIIGVLAAVAVPQYKSLKQNAEVKTVLKTTIDAASSAVNAATNYIDLEEEAAVDVNLSMLVSLKGKGWTYTKQPGRGTYVYVDAANFVAHPELMVAVIDFNSTNRVVNYSINCQGFADTTSQSKCQTAIDVAGTGDLNETLTF